MSEAFTSKLKLPTKINLNSSKNVLKENQNAIGNNYAGPFTRRRSKSVCDLRLANATNKPETLLKKTLKSFNTTVPKKNVAVQARKIGLRKSSSNPDLRNINKQVKKPISSLALPKKTITKPIINKAVTRPAIPPPTTTRKVQKRPATDKISEPSKPKVAKPAPYDFKARFGLLQEKHTKLVDNYKETQLKLADLTESNLKCMEESNDLHKEIENLTKKIKKLQETELTLKRKYSELEQSNFSIKSDYERAQSDLLKANTNIIDLQNDIESYKGVLSKSHNQIRDLHNKVQDLKGNIRVFCRVRPPKEDEDYKSLCRINILDECNMEVKKAKESCFSISGKPMDLKQEFAFDRVFSEDSTQDEVFEDLSQLVQSALDGYNVCVFAYGQTGSGKTFTMQGTENNLGMIPKTFALLFKIISKLEKFGWKYKVEACFMEIYNEIIRDLLNKNTKQSHEIRYNEGKGATVTNLQIETIETEEALQELMLTAQKNRAVAATNFNEHSSRSHAVTKIMLEGYHEESNNVYTGSLNLVDLAGSESAKNTASDRMQETKNINKSLSTLGTVMLALHNGENHIPYRNSKLTYLLQSCLGGNSKTLMFVNISPFEDCYNETINSLRFAAKVKEVKLGSKRQKSVLK